MDLELAGKRVLVTGGARGLGLEMVKAFAEEGCDCHSIDLGESSGPAQHTVLDVTNHDALKSYVSQLNPDILVNNAGIAVNKLLPKFTLNDIDRVLTVNVQSILSASQALFHTRKKNRATVINVASILGLIGAPLGVLYGASKGAVVSMTRSLAIEGARHGHRVNAICPGMINTDMSKSLRANEQMYKANLSMIPMGRFAESREVADLCLFLASDKSSYITGQNIAIDGGYTAR